MEQQYTLYKLIVLHMLSRVDYPMTYSQISDFVLGRGYTDGFTLQSAVSELADDSLILRESSGDNSFYSIAPEGVETLKYLRAKLSLPIKDDIDLFLRESGFRLRNETSVRSEYYRTSDGTYVAECSAVEKDEELIHLTISLPTEAAAKAAADGWKRDPAGIYQGIINLLTSSEK